MQLSKWTQQLRSRRLWSSQQRRNRDHASEGKVTSLRSVLPRRLLQPQLRPTAIGRSASPRLQSPGGGAGRFVSSGCLNGLQREDTEPAARRRVEFSEATQEQLYLAVHGAKTAGKKGLGRGASTGELLKSGTSSGAPTLPGCSSCHVSLSEANGGLHRRCHCWSQVAGSENRL